MDLTTFRQLISPQGQRALQEATGYQPEEQDFLRLYSLLSRVYPAELARAALETAILRRQAREKFPLAESMYFTRQALEQATHHAVAAYRSRRFVGFERLIDLGCSIGGDTLELARIAPTLGVDLDALRLAMARENVAAVGLDEQTRFIQADLNASLPIHSREGIGVFFDPGRRSAERRAFSILDYQPPLTIIEAWLARFPALGVKISPGVKLDELSSYPAEIEFVSYDGELKEAALWFGPLKSAARRATVLPAGRSLALSETDGAPDVQQAVYLSEPRAFLYEPDPAVLRAGLVRMLAEQIGARQLDPDIAYLTSDQRVETPFARVWAVDAWFPFHLKRLREALRQRDVERATVKKRGSPIQPQELIRWLRLPRHVGTSAVERVIFLTHLRGQPVVILCFP